jgi:8-oxo-dGTP pyrophosphatase MutT (NUDIX family)
VSVLPGVWAGISGRVEPGEAPVEAALREMEEETGVSRSDVSLSVTGRPLEIPDRRASRPWFVHPFLGSLRSGRPLRLDWEHAAYRWARRGDLARLRTVPGLEVTLGALMEELDRREERFEGDGPGPENLFKRRIE